MQRVPRVRSAVTNGKRLYVEGNGRSPWARRHRDLVELYLADMGPRESLSEAEIGMARRAATLACECEQMDGLLSMGQTVDVDLYARISSHLRRIHETLGVRRAVKDGTPTLSEYLASKASAEAADAS